MIDLYYFPTPNTWKVSIFLEETGLEYRVIMVNILEGEQFDPAFLKISPNNRVPAIVDHDVLDEAGQPLTLISRRRPAAFFLPNRLDGPACWSG